MTHPCVNNTCIWVGLFIALYDSSLALSYVDWKDSQPNPFYGRSRFVVVVVVGLRCYLLLLLYFVCFDGYIDY